MDLHIHTIYSDGSKTPKEIMNIAREIGLTTVAITDHDMINGVKTLTEDDLGELELIPGVEMTANVAKGRMHILGYGIDVDDVGLNDKLNNRNDLYNLLMYVEYLKKMFNIEILEEDIVEIKNKIGNVGRPELAKLLIKYGYVTTINEAFTNYLNAVMEACRDQKRGYTKEECLEMITQAGGLPVLAHPISLMMDEDELRKEILYLKQCGLKGIETQHIQLDAEYRRMVEKIADDYELLTTGGTDYHGDVKPNVHLGTGIDNNINVTSSTLVDYLRKENKQKIKCKKINTTKL